MNKIEKRRKKQIREIKRMLSTAIACGMNIEQISEMLNIPEETIESILLYDNCPVR